MCFDFEKTLLPKPELPTGFCVLHWDVSHIQPHAELIYQSFHNDTDGAIFPTFRDNKRCLSLMQAVAASSSFLPAATFLIGYSGEENTESGLLQHIAGIQGMRHSLETGAIQNVAVLPEFRRKGIGRALVLSSLHGFRSIGCLKVTLECTAENYPAVKLYQQCGFGVVRVYHREILP
ncbi:MAG: GNAT family N-acetyltransferase [Planctomycetaceae bacterium]|nr:GNAT family N-acetyltransferase [Planctomycetaceae bacterium]